MIISHPSWLLSAVEQTCSGGAIYAYSGFWEAWMCFLLLFVSPRKGTQTGEQQADDDRRGPFSRKYRSLTSANPPHYSQSSLAGRASFRRQYRWLRAFSFSCIYSCLGGSVALREDFFFFFGKQTLVKTQGCNICQQEERWHQTNHQRRPLLPLFISFRLHSQVLHHPPIRLIVHSPSFLIAFVDLEWKFLFELQHPTKTKTFFLRKFERNPYRYLFFFSRRDLNNFHWHSRSQTARFFGPINVWICCLCGLIESRVSGRP